MSSVEEQEEKKRGGRGRRAYLSEDLMVEILLKLPVRSLLRFKCVCKSWYNLILSPDFIAVHHMNNRQHNHTNEIPMSYIASSYNAGPPSTAVVSFRINRTPIDLTIPVKADNVEIVGCSNGIVCLSGSYRKISYKEFVLWNPVRRQCWHIGCYGTYNNSRLFSFYFDPIANSFMLVGIAYVAWENTVKVSRFTTCHKLWRKKVIDVPYPLYESDGIFVRPIASVNRYMYWHVISDGKTRYILRFDVIDELFERYEFPEHAISSSSLQFAGYKESIVVFAHKLADRCGFCSSFDVYQLTNDPDQPWHKILTTCEPSVNFTRALRFFKKENVDFVVLTTRKQYFCSDTEYDRTGSLLYNPQTKKTTEFSLEDRERKRFGYNERFASLQ